MRIPRITIPLVLCLAAAIAVPACGGDDDDVTGAAPSAASMSDDAEDIDLATDTTDAPETDDAASSDDGGGELPDPCALVPADVVGGIVGGDIGIGTVQDPMPERRRSCVYQSGLTLAVEVSDDWELTLEGIEQQMGADALEEVSGVGKAAVWQQESGGWGQFLALGDDVFVGVTLTSGGRTTGQAVAEAMLAAL